MPYRVIRVNPIPDQLPKDEDFGTFGENHASSADNHQQSRRLYTLPSEMQSFALAAQDSGFHFHQKKYGKQVPYQGSPRIKLLEDTIDIRLYDSYKDKSKLVEHVFYIRQEEHLLTYTVRLPTGLIHAITTTPAPNPLTLKNLNAYKQKILGIAEAAGHVLPSYYQKKLEDNVLYLSQKDGLITYTVKGPMGKLSQTTNLVAPQHFTIDQLIPFKQKIQELAEKAGHILAKPYTTVYENIECATYTLSSPARESTASNYPARDVRRFNVPEGFVGKILNVETGEPFFVPPGDHLLFAHGLNWIGNQSVNDSHIAHGNLHVVTVKPHEIYSVKANNEEEDSLKLLLPGVHQFELANAFIAPVINPHDKEVKVKLSEHGPEKIKWVKVPKGKGGICLLGGIEEGAMYLSMLSPGLSFIDSQSTFYTLVSTKNVLLHINKRAIPSKDGELVNVKATIQYRMLCPYSAMAKFGIVTIPTRNEEFGFVEDFYDLVPGNVAKEIEKLAETQIMNQVRSLISLKHKRTSDASVYDAVFNAEVVRTLNAKLRSAHIEISKVSISHIEAADPQVLARIEEASAQAIVEHTNEKYKWEMISIAEHKRTEGRIQLIKQNEIAQLEAELEEITREVKSIEARSEQEISAILSNTPGAAEIYAKNPVSQSKDSFFASLEDKHEFEQAAVFNLI